MCLFPRLMINRKYKITKKNNGNVPSLLNNKVKYVPVACGNCIECRRQIANAWKVRLNEEIKTHKYNYFITLTFNNETFKNIIEKYEISEYNEIVTKCVRLFLERVRKETKKSIRHWLITELGQTKTERIHLHGILFSDKPINNDWLEKLWKYGYTDIGKYCSERTINYIVKYVTKIDEKHKDFKSKILCSKGIGSNYINARTKKYHRFKENTKENYILNNGNEINLPIYYRNKIYSEDEREKLWIQKIDKDIRYINGIKIKNASKNIELIKKILTEQQQNNYELGFGGIKWNCKKYEIQLEKLRK